MIYLGRYIIILSRYVFEYEMKNYYTIFTIQPFKINYLKRIQLYRMIYLSRTYFKLFAFAVDPFLKPKWNAALLGYNSYYFPQNIRIPT